MKMSNVNTAIECKLDAKTFATVKVFWQQKSHSPTCMLFKPNNVCPSIPSVDQQMHLLSLILFSGVYARPPGSLLIVFPCCFIVAINSPVCNVVHSIFKIEAGRWVLDLSCIASFLWIASQVSQNFSMKCKVKKKREGDNLNKKMENEKWLP